MEKLFQVLSGIHPLSDNFKKAIEKEVTHLSLPAHYLLLEAPKVSEHAYFLKDGFAMSYTYFKGRKQIDDFWNAGRIVFSATSFFEQVPSREFIELMVPSEVLCVSHESVMRLFSTFPEAHFIYRVTMNQYYEHCRERIRDLQYMTGVERYEKLHTTYPQIEQVVSQEHLASYLGIAPQSLSRIKRRS